MFTSTYTFIQFEWFFICDRNDLLSLNSLWHRLQTNRPGLGHDVCNVINSAEIKGSLTATLILPFFNDYYKPKYCLSSCSDSASETARVNVIPPSSKSSSCTSIVCGWWWSLCSSWCSCRVVTVNLNLNNQLMKF